MSEEVMSVGGGLRRWTQSPNGLQGYTARTTGTGRVQPGRNVCLNPHNDESPRSRVHSGRGQAVRTGLEPATSAVTGQHSKPTELPDRRSDFLHKGLIAKSLWVPGCGNVHTGSTHGLPLPFSSSDQDRSRGSARDPHLFLATTAGDLPPCLSRMRRSLYFPQAGP